MSVVNITVNICQLLTLQSIFVSIDQKSIFISHEHYRQYLSVVNISPFLSSVKHYSSFMSVVEHKPWSGLDLIIHSCQQKNAIILTDLVFHHTISFVIKNDFTRNSLRQAVTQQIKGIEYFQHASILLWKNERLSVSVHSVSSARGFHWVEDYFDVVHK